MTDAQRTMRRKSAKLRQRRRHAALLLTTLAVIAAGGLLLHTLLEAPAPQTPPAAEAPATEAENPSLSFRETLAQFAQEHDLRTEQWPAYLVEKAEENPELAEFVLQYPIKSQQNPEIDLSDLDTQDGVPLLLQWDERWGYQRYAGGIIGTTGCGPVCLSMVCLYLLDDPAYDPLTIARFSEENGYSVPGSGSEWALISEGGEELGLSVTELPLHEQTVIDHLEQGDPIICIMGPGDFTQTGHFIVLTGCEDGKLKVNDPNSPARSSQLWDFQDIQDQILNLWVCQ